MNNNFLHLNKIKSVFFLCNAFQNILAAMPRH
jgi:hypothetical protein